MSEVFRYDEVCTATTPLNPIEDLCSWVSGLRSTGYSSDILKTKHVMTKGGEIKACADLISTYALNAVAFIEQSFSCLPEVSFLPLYYAVLNLSKIYVIMAGKKNRLEQQRFHGATYRLSQKPRDLLAQKIILKGQGALPLFYESITSEKWNIKDREILLSNVYPYIQGISHEYGIAYKSPIPFQDCSIKIEGSSTDGFSAQVKLFPGSHPRDQDKRYLKLLRGFQRTGKGSDIYRTKKVVASTDQATKAVLEDVRRSLLYQHYNVHQTKILTQTPLSNQQMLLPEEFPIVLAFFHLSNLVRYNPEYLGKIKDSKYWSMVLALRKHALLRFLILFWSYVNRTSYFILH
jgi:hypothetical protein